MNLITIAIMQVQTQSPLLLAIQINGTLLLASADEMANNRSYLDLYVRLGKGMSHQAVLTLFGN